MEMMESHESDSQKKEISYTAALHSFTETDVHTNWVQTVPGQPQNNRITINGEALRRPFPCLGQTVLLSAAPGIGMQPAGPQRVTRLYHSCPTSLP